MSRNSSNSLDSSMMANSAQLVPEANRQMHAQTARGADSESDFSFHNRKEHEESEAESLFSFHVKRDTVKRMKTPAQPPGSRMMGPPVEYPESDSDIDSGRFFVDPECPRFPANPYGTDHMPGISEEAEEAALKSDDTPLNS